MGITLSDLVAAQLENSGLICRKKDRVTVRRQDNMLMQSVHLDEECLLVLEGELFVMFEDEGFLLQKGDSIRVLPNRLHSTYNHSDCVAWAMNIKCKVQY